MSRTAMTIPGIHIQRFAMVNKRGEIIRQQPTPPKPPSNGSSGCLVLLIGFLFLARALAGLLPGQPPDGAHWQDRAAHILERL
jgi:hypothetical protein